MKSTKYVLLYNVISLTQIINFLGLDKIKTIFKQFQPIFWQIHRYFKDLWIKIRISLKLPDLDLHVVACGRYNSIFFIKFDGWDKMIVSIFHFFLFLSKVQVPNSDGLIIRCSVKVLCCWMNGDGSNPIIMTCKCSQMLACLTYEEFNKFIPTSSKEESLMVSLESVKTLLT